MTQKIESLSEYLHNWFETPVGHDTLSWEQIQFDKIVANVFGFYAVQVGMPQYNLLNNNRIRNHILLTNQLDTNSIHKFQTVVSDYTCLPFASESIDLLILPHVLECHTKPHQVLREAERVLVNEGRIIITGFNPISLWGLRNKIPFMKPWSPFPTSRQVSVPRLKDWLNLLSFEIDRGQFGCYYPAITTEKWLKRWDFMNKAGDRWWPVMGSIYMISATKRNCAMRLVGPAWKQKSKFGRHAKKTATAHFNKVEHDE